MRTIRRLYFYTLALIGLEALVWGAVNLLRTVLESGLTFAVVFAVLRWLEVAPLASALIATVSMSTSPAVVLAVTREARSQGQVTERVLLLTALNTIYAVVLSTLLLAWVLL